MNVRKYLGWFLVGAGAFAAASTLWAGGPLAAYVWRAPAAPQEHTVAGVPASTWVVLTDARARCDTRVARPGYTLFVAEDAAGQNPFVAQLEGDVSCEAAAARRWSGAFMHRATAQEIRQLGITPPGDGELSFFTEGGQPAVAKRFLLAMAPWLFAGALGIVTGILLVRRAAKDAAGVA